MVCHDWGCILFYVLDENHPGMFQRIISLDVGARIGSGLKAFLMILAYQWFLIFCFLLGLDRLTWAFARLVGHHGRNVSSRRNYLYYYFWKNQLEARLLGRATVLSRTYKPSAPVTFIYGERKPFMFHSPGWLASCEEVVKAPTGHWIMRRAPELILGAIQRVLR
jgi:pimeloyl-ACP methyl ester carboxylesterase